MFSKRSLEGELVIDHRASPGLTAEDVGTFDTPTVPKGTLYESAVAVCGHCSYAIILEPKRTRERGWCSKCDRYLCDDCSRVLATTLQCRSIKQQIDQLHDLAERGSSPFLLGKD